MSQTGSDLECNFKIGKCFQFSPVKNSESKLLLIDKKKVLSKLGTSFEVHNLNNMHGLDPHYVSYRRHRMIGGFIIR